MASASLKFSFLLALPLALACDVKPGEPGESAGETDTAASEGTDGQGTTSAGDPLTTSGGSSATNGTSVGSSATDPTNGSASATDGDDPVETSTSASTSVGTLGTSATSEGETEDIPVEPPKPCEGEAIPLGPFATQIAYLSSQEQEPTDPTAGSTITSGSGTDPGSGGDPNTLTIRFSSHAFTCEDPSKFLECGQGDGWNLQIRIPPEFQSPGLYNLFGSDIIAISDVVLDEGGDGCGFGGSTVSGSLEIFAVDGDKVEGRLCHVEALFGEDAPDLEGSFVAPRCQ